MLKAYNLGFSILRLLPSSLDKSSSTPTMEPAITEEILPAEEYFTTEETLPAITEEVGAKCSRE